MLNRIKDDIIDGNRKGVAADVQQALDAGRGAEDILNEAMIPAMGNVIEAIAAAGLRDQVKVMVGGAPLSQAYSDSIGADGYSSDANEAVALAKKLAA